MAIPKNFRDGSVVISDGTAVTPLNVTATFETGDFSIEEAGPGVGGYETSRYLSRGELIGLRKTNKVAASGSMSFTFSEFTLNSTGNVIDMIRGTGTDFGSRVSTSTALGDVMTFDIVLTIEGTDLGDAADHTATLTDVEVTSIGIAEGDPNTVSLGFTIHGTITYA